MLIALIILTLAQPLGIAIMFGYLDRRDARERVERDGLLRRIQSPSVAMVADAAPIVNSEPQHLPFDDDEAFIAYQHGLNGHGTG